MHDQIAALLDDGLARLGNCDRTAVAMRYLQEKSVREVAQTIGISEAAAQKRINRGIAKLRDGYARRGIRTEADGLASQMTLQGTLVAPAALTADIATVATSATTRIATATLRTMLMVKIQVAAVVCGVVMMVAGTAA